MKFAGKGLLTCMLGAGLVLSPLAGTTVFPMPAVEAAVPIKAWDFSQDIGGWSYLGGYAYSGDAETAFSPEFGGSLKLDVDFSEDKEQSWSEVKLMDMNVNSSSPIQAGNGIKAVSFDFYYDASQLKGDAALKVKLYASNVKGSEVINQPVDDLGVARAKAVPGTKLKKASVRVLLDKPVKEDIGHFEWNLVGYLTSYKGAVYINNLRLE